jgi:hypothetical protein
MTIRLNAAIRTRFADETKTRKGIVTHAGLIVSLRIIIEIF